MPGLQAGALEIEAGGPSYTADTLAKLADKEPDAELFTIVGDDAAAGLPTWERHDEVLARSRVVVVDRPGNPVQLPGDVPWIHVEVPRLEVSSTDLRARFTDGRPLDYLVTDPVLHLIAARGLYQDPAVTASPDRRRRCHARRAPASPSSPSLAAAGLAVAGGLTIYNSTDAH